MIVLEDLRFEYETFEKTPGLKGTLNDFFNRKKVIVPAINDISLKIETGEIVGLIGPNGAGKTTLTKLLTGIIAPSSGQVVIDDYHPSAHPTNFLKNIGVMFGQKSQLSWNLPAIDTFNMLSAIYNLDEEVYSNRLNYLTKLLQVDNLIKIPVRKLSLGQRVKCELICSLLHSPSYLFLDEPTLGLDLVTQETIYKFLIDENKNNNTTIILTSHNLRDIEATSQRLLLMSKGEIIFDGSLNDLPVDIQQHQFFRVKYLDEAKNRMIERTMTSSTFDDELSNLKADNIISINREGMTVNDLILSIYKTLE